MAILVGGGPAADVVRDWSHRFSLSDTQAHWLAIQAMGLNTALLATLLPEAILISGRTSVLEATRPTGSSPLFLIDPLPLMRDLERHARQPLPESWEATSDSIAAWLAEELSCEELWLLKSCHCPADASLAAATQQELIDPLFARFLATSSSRTVRWVNLRASFPQTTVLYHQR